ETVEFLLYRQRRQQGVVLLARWRQHTAEAVELQDLALGLEQTLGRRPRARAWGLCGGALAGAWGLCCPRAGAWGLWWGGGGNLDVGHGEDRRRHLAGDEAIVDQRVQPQLIAVQTELRHPLGRVGHVGGTNRLVRLLGALARGEDVRLCRQVGLAEG